MEKFTCHGNTAVLTGLVERTVIKGIQFGWDAFKEGIENTLFNLVGEPIVDNIQKVKMNPQLMWNTGALNPSDWTMDPLTQQGTSCKSFIVSTTAHVKHHINEIEEEHRLAQRLEQHFSETNYPLPLARSKVKRGLDTPVLAHLQRLTRMRNVNKGINFALGDIIRGVTALALHSQRAIKKVNWTVGRRTSQFQIIQ